ncbi:TRAP transporter large permease [Oceanivirga salmonicida]|uniref:TRAP transporter large permease n=1 Tax=Oceanivirga salmonicida TaxID=1769291 RepID=UPI00082A253A|nr:TRAP transporter large permease subunit [Oceanivirga salmonicida]
MALQSLLILIFVLLILLFIGIPISYAIAFSSLIVMLQMIDFNIIALTGAQRIFVGMSNFTLTAIPFFILAGNLMNQGGIAKKLINLVLAILGKLPGSLLIANAGANGLFGAISGSASAAAAAVGGMVKNEQEKQGYDKALSAATNIASAPSGLLIPPSNALITYSLVSGGTSIAALFIAGYIPGLIWVLGCFLGAIVFAKRAKYKSTDFNYGIKNVILAILDAIPALSLIVIVIGGIVKGIFTATEGSAIAVVYALILGILYKNITVKKFVEIVIESAKLSGMIVFLIGVSNILGWVMAFTQIPQSIAMVLLGLTQNKIILLLMINIILLIAGTFMDVTPAIVIFTPLFLPVVRELGVHPVHFGIILVYNLCIGNITPPVGNTLFVGVKVGNTTLEKVMKYMVFYYVLILIGLLFVTYIPTLSLFLPKIAGLL